MGGGGNEVKGMVRPMRMCGEGKEVEGGYGLGWWS